MRSCGALLESGSWSGQIKHHAKDGSELTVESRIELVKIGDRRLVLESTRDITDWLRWEERQKLLLGELSHRVKNTLTVVQSMARQTLRTSATGEAFVERFEGRIAALANAHKLLFDSTGTVRSSELSSQPNCKPTRWATRAASASKDRK